MGCASVLKTFKIEHEDCLSIKGKDDSKVPKINDKENDRKIIQCSPMLKDYLSSSCRSCGPLVHVLRLDPTFTNDVMNLLFPGCYYGENGSLISELEYCLPHGRPIFKNDNATVYTKIEEDARGTSLESIIKSFSRHKDRRGTFQAFTSNHAGEVKYRAISKKRLNIFQNIKWNGRDYPLE